jgi:hypothetical protein
VLLSEKGDACFFRLPSGSAVGRDERLRGERVELVENPIISFQHSGELESRICSSSIPSMAGNEEFRYTVIDSPTVAKPPGFVRKAMRVPASPDLPRTVPVLWLVDIGHQREPRKTRNTRKLEKKFERRCVRIGHSGVGRRSRVTRVCGLWPSAHFPRFSG